jgi:hypothetical protein
MGVDYTAFTIIGVRMPLTDLMDVKHVAKPAMFLKKCCKKYTETDFKCCPDCGNLLWRSERAFVPKIDGWTEEDWDNRDFFGHKIVTDSGWYGLEKCNLFIGVRFGGYGNVATVVEIPDDVYVDKLKQELWRILYPLGLWKEESFGLWTYLDVG